MVKVIEDTEPQWSNDNLYSPRVVAEKKLIIVNINSKENCTIYKMFIEQRLASINSKSKA